MNKTPPLTESSDSEQYWRQQIRDAKQAADYAERMLESGDLSDEIRSEWVDRLEKSNHAVNVRTRLLGGLAIEGANN